MPSLMLRTRLLALTIVTNLSLVACSSSSSDNSSSTVAPTSYQNHSVAWTANATSFRQGVLDEVLVLMPEDTSATHFEVIALTDAVSIDNSYNKQGRFRIYYAGSSDVEVQYRFLDSADTLISTQSLRLQVQTKSPLFTQQWALDNTGQKAYADNAGIAGYDINFKPVLQQGITGKGVRIAVIDSSFEIEHEDLKNQIITNASYDFQDNDLDPSPSLSYTGDSHGTKVAGIIGMQGWNNVGGMGVAPQADLQVYNYLDAQTNLSFLSSVGLDQIGLNANTLSQQADVFNLSFGSAFFDAVAYGDESYEQADIFRCLTAGNKQFDYAGSTFLNPVCSALRAGKGAIYVQAAGNDFDKPSDTDSRDDTSHCLEQTNHLSCDVVSGRDPFIANPFVIPVGAINALGKRASYSSAGSALWLVAPAGEFGYSDTVFQNYGSNRFWDNVDKQPAIITTDLTQCGRGADVYAFIPYSITPFHGIASGYFSNHRKTPHIDNPYCNYVSNMNGTSASAPMVSGIAALMLEANANLTWRDIKYILAKTARQIDTDIASYDLYLDAGAYQARLPWLTNSAGFAYHNWYGFGLVDAAAAVTLAQSYSDYRLNANFAQSNWLDLAITQANIQPFSNNGAEASISISNSGISQIEAVQIRLSLDATSRANGHQLNIRLISPSGMQSQLLHANSSLKNLANDMVFFSNAFFQEDSIGTWKVEIVNSSAASLHTGILTDAKIRFFGEKLS